MISTHDTSDRPVRYAVVGLGHIAQNAVLPAFRNAKDNSRLTALVSSDPTKLQELKKKYKVPLTFSYEEYDACLASGEVDAVFIALPNHMHCEYAVRAAEAKKHVLCEKPMAVTEAECRRMLDAADRNDVRLMIAYRLHFEEANLKAVQIVRSGRIGEPRYFSSDFSMQVKAGNIRTRSEDGGGTLYDIGIYCINAARYLFRDEPNEVFARSASGPDPRFAEVDEATSVILKFPGDRLAMLTSSFGAADVSEYRVVGTKGDLRMDPAYGYAGKLQQFLTVDGKTTKQTFAKRDQFAAELLYFSRCVQQRKDPEPSGVEGLADVRIIEACYRSVVEERPIALEPFSKPVRPTPVQDIEKPPVSQPDLVHAEAPSE